MFLNQSRKCLENLSGVVRTAWRASLSLCLASLSLVVPITAYAESLAGHYYLRGIREVGSELQLNGDNTYEWFLSYGATDHESSGTWVEKTGKIVLTPRKAKKDRPLLELRGIEPWSEAEEQIEKEIRDDQVEGKARLFCPFRIRQKAVPYVNGQPANAPEPDGSVEAPAPIEIEEEHAKLVKEAVAQVKGLMVEMYQLRSEGMAAIDKFMAETEGTESWAKAANEILDTFEKVKQVEQKTRHAIALATEADESYRNYFDSDDLRPLWQYADFKCKEKVDPTVPPSPKTVVAIYGEDPDWRVKFGREARVTFTLAPDGSSRSANFSRGHVLVLLKEGQSIKSIDVELKDASGQPLPKTHFDVKGEMQTVIHLVAHFDQLAKPPFESLELPIKGKRLQFKNGFYEKGN